LPRRAEEDRKLYRDVIDGKLRKSLKEFFKSHKFVTKRARKGRMIVTIPQIDIPNIVFGESDEGIGRGPGKPGDVFKKDPPPGQGNQAGNEAGEGIEVSIDMEEILMFLESELELPRLEPKPNETFEEVKIKYNDISLVGPESLRHNRRTILQALKRQIASGDFKNHFIPGFVDPVRLITPINSDKRYRQYKEIKIPSSNAAIMFGRDGSGSMDDYKCEIVSDMAWWIDIWIRRFYGRVERCYFWHDTIAEEVDEHTFYRKRQGGGTNCTSCPRLMAEQFDNRFPPDKWNIYCFYFSDGDNWGDDNAKFVATLKEQFPATKVNLFGITQILCNDYSGSLKKYVDDNYKADNVQTVSIGPEESLDYSSGGFGGQGSEFSDDERNESVVKAIKALLGKGKVKAGGFTFNV
jgi:uncharacterized sporulation protein YeaH/YhbH (DUF444 family)